MMVKQSSLEKTRSKCTNSNKIVEDNLVVPYQYLTELKIDKQFLENKEPILVKTDLKSECMTPDIENVENYILIEKPVEEIENNHKFKKRIYSNKVSKEVDDKKSEFTYEFGQLKLSQTVIVGSILKSNKIDQNIKALLPDSLTVIYNRFINSKKYTESLYNKDNFFCGIGLLGVNIEEKIYNKRKALEESLRRGSRLRPNPKPTKLFDGTIINRPIRNSIKISKTMKSSANRVIGLHGKDKYNLFNIGIDASKKKSRRGIRKTVKKKFIANNRSLSQKLGLKKEINNQHSGSSDEDLEDKNSKCNTLNRPKRQQKIPKINFKYCYDERITCRNRKYADSNSDGAKSNGCGREFLEIVDSDSSSVVEVSPPNDIDLSDESDGVLCKPKDSEQTNKSKGTLNMRRGWKPKESKALNLLDKLRLGLQCTIIQTEHDIIIQNLSHDDLTTLQSRLQGLAPFKNIEAEYDKNGQETARATIDRKMLKLGDNVEIKTTFTRKYDDSLKRKLFNPQIHKFQSERKKLSLSDNKSLDELNKSFKKYNTSNTAYKSDDCSSVWTRPKGRSVKKVRKLYTQSGSTPNILSRSQIVNRTDNLLTSSSRSAPSQSLSMSKNQPLSFSQSSSLGCTADNSCIYNQHAPTVSFYSQLSTIASNITSIPVVATPVISEIIKPVSFVTSTNVTVPISHFELLNTTTTITELNNNNGLFNSINNSVVDSIIAPSISTENSKKMIPSEKLNATTRTIDLVSPATAMSASQLLMRKRGGAKNNPEISSLPNNLVSIANNTDQSFANQILKPLKKTFVTSSPPKLELDDEEVEADFELTPSMITQVKNVTAPVNLMNLPNLQTKNNIIPKPLIQSSGITPSSRRTISLANTPLFQAQNSVISSPSGQSATYSASASTKTITVFDKPVVCVVTAQSVVLPNSGITTTANNNLIQTNISNNQNSPSASVKIKQRKWTHNFHTSNSINFRDVLCSYKSNNVQPIICSQMQLPISSSNNLPSNPKPITIPNIISTNIVKSLKLPENISQTPTKGSSVVLKSLLVGSHSSDDLCNLNKSSNWASKYLSSTSTLQDSSKIKWQVGGTVVTSLSNLILPVSKESTLEVVNTNNCK